MLYRKAELDVDAVTELVMWIENDYRLYQMQEHYNKNMARKTANGTYDRNLAVKQYMPLAEAGAKSYVKEFGGVWHQIFPMDVRRAAAEYFRDYFENEVAVNPARFEKHVFKKDVKKWRERYPQRGAAVYPKDVAEEVSLSRPDLAAGDAIATVLTWDPTLTADEVIEILDQSAADYRDEVEYERRPQRGAAVRRAFRDDAPYADEYGPSDSESDYDDEYDDAPDQEELYEAYVIQDRRGGGYELSHEGRVIAHNNHFDRLIRAAKRDMKAQNFYPNIYFINDHGNVDLLDYDGHIVQSWV